MKLPEKLDRIAKMELKPPSLKRSKHGNEPASTEEHGPAPVHDAASEKAGGRFAALKKPASLKRPSLGRKRAAGGGAASCAAVSASGARAASRKPEKAPRETSRLPGPVNDLLRDLRDRHLLFPVAALLVALVAIPLMLSRSAEPAPPVPPAPDLASADAITPAVMVENVGVRDYRKRLDALKRSNPFEAPKVDVDEVTDDGGVDTGTSTTDPGGTDLPATDTGAGLPTDTGTGLSTDSGVTDPGAAPPADGETDTGADDGTSDQPADPIIRYIDQVVSYDVDVFAGPVLNGLDRYRNLKSYQLLPSKTNPVAAYIGVDEGGTKAAFLLSRDSTVTSNGGGDCLPSPESCEFILLEANEFVRVDYQRANQQEATAYRVKVGKIAERRTRVRD